jgi:hypothetical protein
VTYTKNSRCLPGKLHKEAKLSIALYHVLRFLVAICAIVLSGHHIFAHRFPFICIVLLYTSGICIGLDCVGPCLSTTCELLSKSHIFKIKTKLTIKIVCLFLSKKKTVRPNCTNNFNIHLCTHKISNGRHNTPFVLVYKVILFFETNFD